MSNPEPDRIKEAAITIGERFVISPEWPADQVEDTVASIEKVIREAVAQKDLDADKPKHSLLSLWHKHSKANLTDEELHLMIHKLNEVNEFMEEVRTDRLFFIMNINTLQGFAEARKEHKKYGGN